MESTSQKLDEETNNLLKCALCPNMCEFACPVLEVEGRETVSPSRKARLGYFYRKGVLDGEEIADSIFYCVSCDACKAHCPFELSVNSMLVPIREGVYEEGVAPDEVEKIKKNIESSGTIYEEIKKHKHDGMEPKESKILYFRGCRAREEAPEIVDATIHMFDRLEVEVHTLPEEICCGSPALELGLRSTFLHIAKQNKDIIEERGVEAVVCSCPTCVHVFREIYPEHGIEINAKFFHVSEYLEKNVKIGKSLKLPSPKKAVYHDPCTLARKLDMVSGPRSLLDRISNLSVQEPYYNKEETFCCGNSGPLKIVDEETAREVGRKRYQHLKEYSDLIVTACPSCKVAFEEAGEDVEVLDFVELLAAAKSKRDLK